MNKAEQLPLFETGISQDVPCGGGDLSTAERCIILQQDYGFTPVCINELTRAFVGVIPFENEPGGTGKHLNEVLLHQINHGEQDPKAAVRSVVRSMILFRNDARTRTESLIEGCDKLSSGVNPNTPVSELVQCDELSMLTLLTGIQHSVNRRAVIHRTPKAIVGNLKGNGVAKKIRTPYDIDSNDVLLAMMKLETLPPSQQRAKGFLALIKVAQRSQSNRLDFWNHALDSAQTHDIARVMLKGDTK